MLSFFKPTPQSRSWTFLSSLQVPHPHFSPSLPYSQPWQQQTLYISLHLSRNLYKWNHTVCILGLASFTRWNDFWDSCMLLPLKIFLLFFLSLNSWHHWLNGPEFEQVPGDSEGQGHLAAAVHGLAESRIQLSDWTTTLLNSIALYGYATFGFSMKLWF